MAIVLLTGGTGFLGKKIIESLHQQNYTIHVLSQKKIANSSPLYKTFYWNTQTQEIDKNAFEGVEYIINLAGATIAKRWTPSYKKEIIESRVQSIKLLKNTIEVYKFPIKAFISVSGVGYYGNSKTEKFTEKSEKGSDFLAFVVQEWEKEAQTIKDLGIRTVIFRLGVVFDKNEGAFPKMILPVKFCLRLIIGSGNLFISWISGQDVCKACIKSIENESFNGIYNLCVPKANTQEELIEKHSQFLNKKGLKIRLPELFFMLLMGEQAQIITKGSWVIPERLQKEHNFEFECPTLDYFLEKT